MSVLLAPLFSFTVIVSYLLAKESWNYRDRLLCGAIIAIGKCL